MSTTSVPRLVLASGSPRRIEALRGLGLDPLVRPADIDETPRPGESPDGYALRLAREKAQARAESGELVLGADTIVVLDDQLLGKPSDAADARAMLGRLAGRVHQVLTGIALVEPTSERHAESLVSTKVRLASMSDEEIDWYVGTGEPMDKAGSYAIQGIGSMFVHSIDGNYSNVVGLPLAQLRRMLRDLGYDLRRFRSGPDVAAGSPTPRP